MSIDTQAATNRLIRFLAVEGVTGKEAAIGRELAAALRESGVPADAIRLDDANTRIPVPPRESLPTREAQYDRNPKGSVKVIPVRRAEDDRNARAPA